MTKPLLKIDLVSDVVCPWCIIGYKRFEKAVELLKDELSVDVCWHPFELNPLMPVGGENLRSHLANKYGTTLEGSIAARAKLTGIGKELGFTFSYFDEMRMYNTRNAHKLLHWATNSGKQTALQIKLFEVFFSNQQSLDDTQVLLDAVKQAGLDEQRAAIVLADNDITEEVIAAEKFWLNQGIQGVPAFVINRKHLISGAQETDTFVEALRSIATSNDA